MWVSSLFQVTYFELGLQVKSSQAHLTVRFNFGTLVLREAVSQLERFFFLREPTQCLSLLKGLWWPQQADMCGFLIWGKYKHLNKRENRLSSTKLDVWDATLMEQVSWPKCWNILDLGISFQYHFPGYALSSVEGRVAMEFFDTSEAAQSKKYNHIIQDFSVFVLLPVRSFPHLVFSHRYAFKCHRKSEAGRDLVFPVNTIAFHPQLVPTQISDHLINNFVIFTFCGVKVWHFCHWRMWWFDQCLGWKQQEEIASGGLSCLNPQKCY